MWLLIREKGRCRMNINDSVDKSKKGDIKEFIALLEAKKSSIYKIAFIYAGNDFDAQDCISEATIRAFDKLHQLKKSESFYTWFFSILINTCRALHNKKNLNISYDECIYDIKDSFFEASIEEKLILENILQSLKKDERDMLVLRYLNDFKISEIATIMKVPEATLKTRFYRLITRLRKTTHAISNDIS